MDTPEPPQVLVVAEDPLARLLTADLLVDAGFMTCEVSPDQALDVLYERPNVETVVLVSQGVNDIYLSYLGSVLRESWPQLELLELREELIFCTGRRTGSEDPRTVNERLVTSLQPAVGGRASRTVQERDPRRRTSIH